MVSFTGGGAAPKRKSGYFGGMVSSPAPAAAPAAPAGARGPTPEVLAARQQANQLPPGMQRSMSGMAVPIPGWRPPQPAPQMSEPLPPAAAAVGAGAPQMSDVLPMAPAAPAEPVEPPQTANPYWLQQQAPQYSAPIRMGYFGGMV